MSDPEPPFLSPAEWRVYSLLSKKGPLTVRQLIAELETSPEPTRSYTTILTLAQRLSLKGYLSQSEKAASHGPASAITYSPVIPYAEALRRHAQRFLAQYALGDPNDLSLVRDEIDQLLIKS
jgi:predicted transcriptional regulator